MAEQIENDCSISRDGIDDRFSNHFDVQNIPWLGGDQALMMRDYPLEHIIFTMGISFTPALFARMKGIGRGPYVPGSHRSDTLLMRWVAYAFDIDPYGPSPVESFNPLPADLKEESRPLWLIASEDRPEVEQLEKLLGRCGAKVVRAFSALETAQMVSKENLGGLIMWLNGKVDAEFVISDVCLRKGIPFIVISNGVERPSSMQLGGMLLHNPCSTDEVLSALKMLPVQKLPGLILPPSAPA